MENILFQLILAILLSSVALMIYGVIYGPLVFDRIMCINCITNYAIMIISFIASIFGYSSLLDIAIIYGLISYVSNLAFLRYFTNDYS